MTVWVVNAQSPNVSDAIRYLECYAEGLPAWPTITMVEGGDQPVEDERYAANKQDLDQDLAALEADIQAAGELTPALRELRDVLTARQQELEEERWEYSPETVARYQAIAPYLRIPQQPSASSISLPNLSPVYQGFTTGWLSVDLFISQLENVQRLMNLEQPSHPGIPRFPAPRRPSRKAGACIYPVFS